MFMENKKVLKLTDFQKTKKTPLWNKQLKGLKITLLRNTKVVREVIKSCSCCCWYRYRRSIQNLVYPTNRSRWRAICKLYLANFAAFFNLSQSAIRVFGYILTCMKPKNDMIIFDRRKCLEYTQYKSDKAIYKGLAELVQSEIIARGPNEYNWFINPLIVFNGDRVSFTKTYVRKKTLAAQKKEEAEKRQLSLGFDEL